ncbi:unnamed protein product [Ectocarpus sp. 12 AP-2014]
MMIMAASAAASTTANAGGGGGSGGSGSNAGDVDVDVASGGGGGGGSAGVAVDELTPSGLQGSDAEEEHLSGLSDLESLMEDQELPGSQPFGPVSTAAEVAGTGGDGMDDGMVDEDAFVDALLDA